MHHVKRVLPSAPPSSTDPASALLAKIESRSAVVGVVGLGYVGLPLMSAVVRAGFTVIGFDIDPEKIESLTAGRSTLSHFSSAEIQTLILTGRWHCTSNMSRLTDADVVIFCVPTPLTPNREPDLSYIESVCRTAKAHMRKGQLYILESTTYPGTTSGVVEPILEQSGYQSGIDFFLAYSPKREDPGNSHFNVSTISKVVAGIGREAEEIVKAFYRTIVQKVILVSSTSTAEAVKLTENIFRSVNIALVNELKMIFTAMSIDIWEVIEAAKTKEFGYMAFYPGPGLGGHCIPVDPFYLTWRAREFGVPTRFVELAGEINRQMPNYVVDRLSVALDEVYERGIKSTKILIVGIAYKKNINDVRESPSLQLMSILIRRGAKVDYFDPFKGEITITEHGLPEIKMYSIELTLEKVRQYQAIIISTDHDDIDYKIIAESTGIILDTRNVIARKGLPTRHLFKA